MKYKDLIEKLLPFAEEEVSIVTNKEECYMSLYDDDPKFGDRKKIVSTVRFYRDDEEGNLIVGMKQEYDAETFENLTKTEFIDL